MNYYRYLFQCCVNHSVEYNQKQTRVHRARGSVTNSFKKTGKLRKKHQTMQPEIKKKQTHRSHFSVYYSQTFIFSFAQRGFIHIFMIVMLIFEGIFSTDIMGKLSTHSPPPTPSLSIHCKYVGSNFPRVMLYLLINCFISV